MIGKIKKGSGFKGCVNYVLGKEQAALLHAEGVLTESRGDIIRSFCMQTGMNPDLKASRTYCAKLFGSGCAQIDRREDDTACAGVYA